MTARPHRRRRRRCFAAALFVSLAAGCGGATHTAGTRGFAAKDLAVLSVPQLPKDAQIRIRSIKFDGAEDEYEIGKGRDFFLLPKDHTASFTLTANIPKTGSPLDWMIPKGGVTLPGPKDLPLGALVAGKTYEFAAPTEGFDKMMETGQLTLVREKPPKMK